MIAPYLKLAALAVLKPVPIPVARFLLKPFARWLWPTHPAARANLRAMMADQLTETTKPEPMPGITGPRPGY